MDVFTTMSLCSGYEGLGLGLKRAIPNIRTVCYMAFRCLYCGEYFNQTMAEGHFGMSREEFFKAPAACAPGAGGD